MNRSFNIEMNLARLKRHYQVCREKYDAISLWDLAHTLRNWADMQDEVEAYFNAQAVIPLFHGYSLTHSCKKQLKSSRAYVIACFPNGGTAMGITFFDFKMFAGTDGYMPEGQLFQFNKTAFKIWLGSEAVRINIKNEQGVLERKILSREIVIKRVANSLGPSHPVSMESKNQFNHATLALMDFHIINGVPLPYFILMKVSEDILAAFEN